MKRVPLGAPQHASLRQGEIREHRPERVRHAHADAATIALTPSRRRAAPVTPEREGVCARAAGVSICSPSSLLFSLILSPHRIRPPSLLPSLPPSLMLFRRLTPLFFCFRALTDLLSDRMPVTILNRLIQPVIYTLECQ